MTISGHHMLQGLSMFSYSCLSRSSIKCYRQPCFDKTSGLANSATNKLHRLPDGITQTDCYSSSVLLSEILSQVSSSRFMQDPLFIWLTILCLCGTLAYAAHSIYLDYRAFLALGPGGTPADFFGYLRVKFLSLFALRDTCQPAPMSAVLFPQTGYLSKLPWRDGQRPVVKGIAPQRQQNQRPPKAVFAHLERTIDALAASPNHQLMQGTSCFEKHGPGLFAIHPRAFAFSSYYSLIPAVAKRTQDASCLAPSNTLRFAHAPVQRERRRPSNCPHEVCHAHPSDGSLHMTLHPADAKLVLERGWGERHPLARGGWLERFVPSGFVLVYAPRTLDEVDIIERMIKAAIWWIAEDTLVGEAQI
jgi:hypothetical protein